MPDRNLTLVAGLVARLVEVATSLGLERAELLAEIGIDPASLEDHDNRLSLEVFARLWSLLSRRFPGRALAVDWVRTWKTTDAGVMATSSSRSARSRRRWRRPSATAS